MEETLVGYALGLLDASEVQAVEAHLQSHPEARVKLSGVRQALEPLAVDKDAFTPPADLAVRTIAHVAEYLVRTEPSPATEEDLAVSEFLKQVISPVPSVSPHFASPRNLAPNSDVEVNTVVRRNVIAAIGLAIAFFAVAVPTVVGLRHYRNLEACQNNLRQSYVAFNTYADLNQNAYPEVKPDETAGKMMDTLHASGVFPSTYILNCPGVEQAADSSSDALSRIDYAYNLGYRDDSGHLHGLSRNCDNLTLLPLLADAPLRSDGTALPCNHRHVHQILFADGHVQTSTKADVGYNQDNIFYSFDSQVHAGVNRFDSVLGRPDEQP